MKSLLLSLNRPPRGKTTNDSDSDVTSKPSKLKPQSTSTEQSANSLQPAFASSEPSAQGEDSLELASASSSQ